MFYGECWKTILRTPRTRARGIPFLNEKIPKDMRAAERKAKDGEIFISKLYQYQVVIEGTGTLIVESWNQKSGETPPAWVKEE